MKKRSSSKTALLVISAHPSIDVIATLGEIQRTRKEWTFIALCGNHDWRPEGITSYSINAPDQWKVAIEHVENVASVYVCATDDFSLPLDLISILLGSGVPDFLSIDDSGTISRYKRRQTEPAKILVVFPGPIVPLTLGSHQRAFNLLSNISEAGLAVDAVITAGKPKDAERAAVALSTVCSSVYTYENNRRKFKPMWRAARWLEQRLLTPGHVAQLPDLFSERAFSKPTESLKITLARLLKERKYEKLIISYAWMIDCIAYSDCSAIKTICDTHDVQFLRDTVIRQNRTRLLYHSKREKLHEVRRLQKMDKVLAISERDAAALRDVLSKDSVICAPAGFDYAIRPVKRRDHEVPLQFGFIGGKMDANQLALKYILDEWLPSIRRYSPESKFFIAGSICNTTLVEQAAFLDDVVVPLGFVTPLAAFYDSIDVALNPVFVQGGLNFKSVEALMAGKHLITNTLGRACLGPDVECAVCESGDDVIRFLKEVEFEVEHDLKLRKSRQNQCKGSFLGKYAYADLIDYLSV